MPFIPGIPQPTDLLSNSQGQLLGNNAQLDVSFAEDHFAFSDVTAHNGKHNQVTTGAYVSSPPVSPNVHPTTAADEPKFYGMQDADQIGVIQYSRGASNAVPSPVTYIQSTQAGIPIASLGNIDVFNFNSPTVLPRAMAMLYVMSEPTTTLSRSVSFVFWNGTTAFVSALTSGGIGPNASIDSGTTLRISNPSGAGIVVYWTLQFLRLQ